MEKIEQESAKQENIERAESLKFINTIKNDIGSTFPFLSSEEREDFLRNFDTLLADNEDISRKWGQSPFFFGLPAFLCV